jgi:RHS repeat-associated protein
MTAQMIVAGQSYYRARYYDPQGGRFLAEDPIDGIVDEQLRLPVVHRYRPTGEQSATSLAMLNSAFSAKCR